MGFFDKLVKAAKTVGDIIDNANNDAQKREQSSAPAAPSQTPKPAPRPAAASFEKKTKQCYFDYANAQPLAQKQFSGTFFDGDENDEDYQIDYTFMATEDFLEGDSGAMEIDMMLGFHTTCDDILDKQYTPPYIVITSSPESQVMNPLNKCLAGESPSNVMMFMRVSDVPMAVCKAKIKVYDQILYLYGVNRGFSKYMHYIGAFYATDAVGTSLEQRLVETVDNIVRTYSETKIKL